jgi:eukaryotic-like serine/threonine-protein kinase
LLQQGRSHLSDTKVSGNDATVAALSDASGELPTMGELLGGRYELLGLLGIGGMGSVYRARDVELDEIVALKMIGRELVSSPLILERFRQEVKLARRVTHRNVARMFDIGEHQKLKFLTMEFIDGESLGDLMEREQILSTARLAEICSAICAGLAAAHDAGVVHRDLKPDNVMLAKDGRVVITDFGIARAVESGAKRTSGMPVGTPAYMAPEQVEGASDIDARADIYALGVMMYEMAVGQPPFEGESMFAVAAARLIHAPPHPQDHKKDVPDVIAKIIVKCMQRRKEDRYANALEVARAFEAITMPALPSTKQAVSATTQPTRASTPSLLSETEDGRKLVAVLPFKNSGKEEDAHIAEGLTEDIVDSLSMVKGIRVRARSSHVDSTSTRDTGELGRLLNVHVVVDGSIRRLGDSLRVTIRLVSVEDGLQLWAKRFEATVGEVFRVGDEAATAIAQALTVERTRPTDEATNDPIAVDLFLRARHQYHLVWHDATSRAIALFAEALKRAPNDARIMGAYALAVARRYAYEFGAEAAGPEAIALAERTLALQPRSSTARAAIAVVKWNDGDVVGTATEIAQALRYGPANADAHDYYGRVLFECGLVDDAIERLKMALAVEARMLQPKYEVIRALALLGKWDEAWGRLGDPPTEPTSLNAYWTNRMRLHGWQLDGPGALACVPLVTNSPPFETQSVMLAFMDVIGGKATPDALTGVLRQFGNANAVARRRSFFFQLTTEIWAARGEHEKALEALEESARGRLSDLAWLDRCPVLEPIRNHPRFVAVRGPIAARAKEAIAALGIA